MEEKEVISYDDFSKLNLKVGKIIKAEPIEESEKLIKLEVDLGEESPRQILAGIKLHYEAEELVGKNIVVIANLEPRKLMGLESNGMLLAAGGSTGKPVLLTTLEDIAPGSEIR
ncbi:MAG: methionine--tRNA ligase subunit beta [Patescibacteria group bacterium]